LLDNIQVEESLSERI